MTVQPVFLPAAHYFTIEEEEGETAMNDKKKQELINKCMLNNDLIDCEKLIYIDIVNNSVQGKFSTGLEDLMKRHNEPNPYHFIHTAVYRLPEHLYTKCNIEYKNGESIYHFTIEEQEGDTTK